MKATFPTTLKKSVLMIALSLALPLTAQAATPAATPAAHSTADGEPRPANVSPAHAPTASFAATRSTCPQARARPAASIATNASLRSGR